jgi:hypothetical protein
MRKFEIAGGCDIIDCLEDRSHTADYVDADGLYLAMVDDFDSIGLL